MSADVIPLPTDERGGPSLPNDETAEAHVAGGVLFHQRAMLEVADLLDARDFYHPTIAAVWEAEQALHQRREGIDSVAVAAEMERQHTDGRCRAHGGPAAFLVKLADAVVTTENIAWSAKRVRDLATKRRLVEGAQRLAMDARKKGADLDGLLRAINDLAADATRRSVRTRLVTQSDSIAAAVKQVERSVDDRRAGRQGQAIATGLLGADRHLDGGLWPEYLVIAGRPSMGKTAALMDLVEGAAKFSRVPCLVFEREMAHTALSLRRLAANSGLAHNRLRAGDLEDADFKPLHVAANAISSLPIWYEDAASDVREIVAIARRWRADPEQGGREPRAVVAVDYMGLVRHKAARKGATPTEVIEYISGAFADLRKELGCTVIALAQLNRALTARDTKRPQLSDLRQSGAIEQDADGVMFVHRPHVFNPKKPPDEAEWIFGKMRNGQVGLVPMRWDAAHTRFMDVANAADDPPKWTYDGPPHADEDRS